MPITEFFDPDFAEPNPDEFKRAGLGSQICARASLSAVTINYHDSMKLTMLCDSAGMVHFVNPVKGIFCYEPVTPFSLRNYLREFLPPQETIQAVKDYIQLGYGVGAEETDVQICTNPECSYPIYTGERLVTCQSCGSPYLDFGEPFRHVVQASVNCYELFVPKFSSWTALRRLIELALADKIYADLARASSRLWGLTFFWRDRFLFNRGKTRFRAAGNLEVLKRYVTGNDRDFLRGGMNTIVDWRTCPAGMLRFIEDHGIALTYSAPDLDPATTQAARSNYVYEKWIEDGLDSHLLNMVFGDYPEMPIGLREAIVEAMWDLYQMLAQKAGIVPHVHARGEVDFFMRQAASVATPDILMQVLGPWVPDHESLEDYIRGE